MKAEEKTLYEIRKILEAQESSLDNYDLPYLMDLTEDEMQDNITILTGKFRLNDIKGLTIEQKNAFDKIVKNINEKVGGIFSIDDPVGSGTTQLYKI